MTGEIQGTSGPPRTLRDGREVGAVVSDPEATRGLPWSPDFLVVGEEFCERLLPAWEKIEAVVDSGGVPVRSLLTPPVTDFGLTRLEGLFERLATTMPGIEVVLNDWGVDRLLERISAPFPKVFGRLLNKQRTDPRLPPEVSHVEAESFQSFLVSRGYRRIEWSPRWSSKGSGAIRLPGTLRWPEAILSWTRSCLAANLDGDFTPQGAIGVVACRQPCRDLDIRLNKRNFPCELMLRGNALLYEVQEPPAGLDGRRIDRIVVDLEPRPWR